MGDTNNFAVFRLLAANLTEGPVTAYIAYRNLDMATTPPQQVFDDPVIEKQVEKCHITEINAEGGIRPAEHY